jgi:hypothetical protein
VNQVIDPADPDALEAVPVGPGPARTLMIAAAWIGVAVIAGLGLWLFWTHVVDPNGSTAVADYVSGDKSVYYSNLGDQFKVEMPTTPTRRVRNDPEGKTVTLESRPAPGYSFSVTRTPQPDNALENYTTVLNTAAGSLAEQAGAEIVKQGDPTAIVDVAVKTLVYRKGNEYYRNMLLLAQGRLYTIQAKVKGDSPKAYNRLWHSFAVLGSR